MHRKAPRVRGQGRCRPARPAVVVGVVPSGWTGVRQEELQEGPKEEDQKDPRWLFRVAGWYSGMGHTRRRPAARAVPWEVAAEVPEGHQPMSVPWDGSAAAAVLLEEPWEEGEAPGVMAEGTENHPLWPSRPHSSRFREPLTSP